MSTRWPGRTTVAALRQASAVRKTVGTVQAASGDTLGGTGTTAGAQAGPDLANVALGRVTALAAGVG